MKPRRCVKVNCVRVKTVTQRPALDVSDGRHERRGFLSISLKTLNSNPAVLDAHQARTTTKTGFSVK